MMQGGHTGGGVTSEVARTIECPICHSKFVDARLLPCLHTFDYRCLVELANYTTQTAKLAVCDGKHRVSELTAVAPNSCSTAPGATAVPRVSTPDVNATAHPGETATTTATASTSATATASTSIQSTTEADGTSNELLLNCPLCREPFYGNLEKLEKLPKNYLINQIAQTLTPQIIMCDDTETHQPMPAAVHCESCDLHFQCADCNTNYHKTARIRQLHKITRIEEYKPTPTLQKCCYDDNKAEYYCYAEEKVLCRACCDDEHKGHPYFTISRAAKNTREFLSELLQVVSANEERLKSILTQLATCQAAAKDEYDSLVGGTKTEFDNLGVCLSAQHAKLRDYFNQTSMTQEKLITTKKTQISVLLESLQQGRQVAKGNLDSTEDFALISMKKPLQDRLEQLIHTASSVLFEGVPDPHFPARFYPLTACCSASHPTLACPNPPSPPSVSNPTSPTSVPNPAPVSSTIISSASEPNEPILTRLIQHHGVIQSHTAPIFLPDLLTERFIVCTSTDSSTPLPVSTAWIVPSYPYCTDHGCRNKSVLCTQCNIPVCSECIMVGSHMGHPAIPLNEAFKNFCAQLQGISEKLQGKISLLTKLYANITERQKTLASHRQSLLTFQHTSLSTVIQQTLQLLSPQILRMEKTIAQVEEEVFLRARQCTQALSEMGSAAEVVKNMFKVASSAGANPTCDNPKCHTFVTNFLNISGTLQHAISFEETGALSPLSETLPNPQDNITVNVNQIDEAANKAKEEECAKNKTRLEELVELQEQKTRWESEKNAWQNELLKIQTDLDNEKKLHDADKGIIVDLTVQNEGLREQNQHFEAEKFTIQKDLLEMQRQSAIMKESILALSVEKEKLERELSETKKSAKQANGRMCVWPGCNKPALYMCANKPGARGTYNKVCSYYSCAEHSNHNSSVCNSQGRECSGAGHHCHNNATYCGLISEFGDKFA
ncbi:hypothetical protein Pelo_14996 [Pelomyxa schiedti]|nr:hypothetical protein Pelo_14996 [Pelomyxa schiedti]